MGDAVVVTCTSLGLLDMNRIIRESVRSAVEEDIIRLFKDLTRDLEPLAAQRHDDLQTLEVGSQDLQTMMSNLRSDTVRRLRGSPVGTETQECLFFY